MRKNLRIQIIGGLICIGIIFALSGTIFFLRQASDRDLSSNTYVKDSTIEDLMFSIKISDGEILIENSLDITTGSLNGYPVVFSTILENAIFNNGPSLRSIDLHNDVNLTLRNIFRPFLQINIYDQCNLRLDNCDIGVIYISDFSSTSVINSRVGMITGRSFETSSNPKSINTSLLIESNSVIHNILQYHSGAFLVKDSIINSMSLLQSNITGKVENSSISHIHSEGKVTLDIHETIISDIRVMGQSQVTLNETTVLSDLWYGVNIYSGSVNITDGIIHGSTHANNTNIINSFINKTHLVEVVAWKSSVVRIINYSVNILLFDSAKVILSKTRDVLGSSYGKLYNSSELIIENSNLHEFQCHDSSELIIENSSLNELQCYDKSSLKISKNSTIKRLWLETSNSVMIDNSSIETIVIYSEYGNLGDASIITNSNIFVLYIWPLSIVFVENCTIQSLYEGICIESGSLTMNSADINESGNYSNFVYTMNNTIKSRSLKFIEIVNSASLFIKDLMIALTFILKNDAKVNLENCIIDYIKAEDSTIVTLDHCIYTHNQYFRHFKIFRFKGALDFYDNSQLYIYHTYSYLFAITQIFLYGNSQAVIENAEVHSIIISDSSAVTIRDSNIDYIDIWASNSDYYSLEVYSSNIWFLYTISWSF